MASPLALAALFATSLIAQSDVYRQEGFEDLPPTSSTPAGPRPIQLRFELQREVALPGPLVGSSLRWSGDRVWVEVSDGAIEVDPSLTPPEWDWVESDLGSASAHADWVEDATGRRRYRTRAKGLLVAERRCDRCRDGWRRAWKLRIAGATVAPPLVLPRRICLGSLGNQIYCVKPKRGFRLWTIDLEDRLSAPLVAVPSPGPETPERPMAPVIIARPDAGDRLLALDGATGVELGRLKLEGQQRLVGGVLATAEGLIVVARQGYAAADARLLTYRLEPTRPAEALTQTQSEAAQP